MRNFTIGITLLLFSTLNVRSQPPIQWKKTYGGTATEECHFIGQVSDGGYIMVGKTSSNDGDISINLGLDDYWIVKIDSLGNIEWEKTYGGSWDDAAYSAHLTTDGGYIVTGFTNSTDSFVTNNHGSSDYWVIKLDNAGSLLWEKALGGSGEDIANSIIQTFDGGYIVAGESNSIDGDVTGNHGNADFWIVKLNGSGAIQWQKSLGGTKREMALSIKQTFDLGYIATGYTMSNDSDVTGNHGLFDYWVVKLDSSGTIQWQNSYGGSDNDLGIEILQTEDSGYILSGITYSNDGDVDSSHGLEDYWILKLDMAGNIEWQKPLGGTNNDFGGRIFICQDGTYLIPGYSKSDDGDVTVNKGDADYWIVNMDATGNILWERSFGGSDVDEVYNAIQSSDGGYIAAGYTMSNDSDVTGNHGDYDIWIVKLKDSIVGILESEDINPVLLFPNPNNGRFVLRNLGPKKLAISIINPLGRCVYRQSINSFGTENMYLNNYPSGIYYLKKSLVDNNGYYKVERFVIIH